MIERIEALGGVLVKAFHLLALFVIGATVVWSAAYFYLVEIMQHGHAKDLTNEQILSVTGAILVLALAALTVEFSAARFQSSDQDI